MTTYDEKRKHFGLETPGTYCIEVEGHLEEKWSERMGGMRISTHNKEDQRPMTRLEGRLRDQAELTGVMNSLYELHLPILSVKLLSEEDAD
jgi:hypothetical protein